MAGATLGFYLRCSNGLCSTKLEENVQVKPYVETMRGEPSKQLFPLMVKVAWTQKLECVKYEVDVSCMFLCLLSGNTFKSFVHLYYRYSLPIAMGLNSFGQIVMHERHQ